MKIGIIGTGKVGTSLGKIWFEKGQEIFFGSRDPYKASKLAETFNDKIITGTHADASKFGEIIVLAIPWSAAEETISSLGDLSGKIIIDVINAVAPNLGGLLIGHTTSAAEKIQSWAKGAKVVKALGAFDPEFLSEVKNRTPKPSLFISGDDAQAKSKAKQLGELIGFEVVDCGPLKNARLLEPVGMLWIELAYNQGMGPGIAFKLLHHRKLPE
ncbi:MAG: NADPH-dependent F420 reductase [Candidatus Lokiarchaeota archaeon]|nr:NADPH-dependent F420 reductase [Candidatus Lokiarchaeota archaeon]